ncbi:hypothetical protein H9L39_09293 [Fusarium oxysporum f. sp. albedinis]|nr:hypothetical protein H9L39_09293 [Fusarium oxysporum f. sp. albedinis]
MILGKIWRVLSSGKIEGITKTKYLNSEPSTRAPSLGETMCHSPKKPCYGELVKWRLGGYALTGGSRLTLPVLLAR